MIEIKPESDPSSPEGNPRELKANRKGSRGDRNETPAAHKGTQGNPKRTDREAEAIEIKHEGDPSSP